MWSDLSMKERHKFIKIAVQCGVYDLDTIHSLYDKQENMDDSGGQIAPLSVPTNPNKKPIDASVALNGIRKIDLEKQSKEADIFEQIKPLIDYLQQQAIKERQKEFLPIPPEVSAISRKPLKSKTYTTGGTISPTDPPYSWIKAGEEAVKPLNQRISHPYKVRATDGFSLVTVPLKVEAEKYLPMPNIDLSLIALPKSKEELVSITNWRNFMFDKKWMKVNNSNLLENKKENTNVKWDEPFVYNEEDKFNNYVNYFFPRFMFVIEEMYPKESHDDHLRRASYLVAHTAYENGYGSSKLFRDNNNLGGDLDANGYGINYDNYESYIRHKLPSMDKRFPGWHLASNFALYFDNIFQRELDANHSKSKYDYCTEPGYKEYKKSLGNMKSMRKAVQDYSGVDMGGF